MGRGNSSRGVLLGRNPSRFSDDQTVSNKVYAQKAADADTLKDLNVHLNLMTDFNSLNKEAQENIFRLLNQQRLGDTLIVNPGLTPIEEANPWEKYYTEEIQKELLDYLKQEKELGKKDLLDSKGLVLGIPVSADSLEYPGLANYMINGIDNIPSYNPNTRWSSESRYELLKKLNFYDKKLWGDTVDILSENLFRDYYFEQAEASHARISFGSDPKVVYHKGKKTLHLVNDEWKETLCGQAGILYARNVPLGTWQDSLDSRGEYKCCQKCIKESGETHEVYGEHTKQRLARKEKYSDVSDKILDESKKEFRQRVSDNLRQYLKDEIDFSSYEENLEKDSFKELFQKSTFEIAEELIAEDKNLFWENLIIRSYDPDKEYPHPGEGEELEKLLNILSHAEDFHKMSAAARDRLDRLENPEKHEPGPLPRPNESYRFSRGTKDFKNTWVTHIFVPNWGNSKVFTRAALCSLKGGDDIGMPENPQRLTRGKKMCASCYELAEKEGIPVSSDYENLPRV